MIQQDVRQECPNKNWWFAIVVAMFLHAGWAHIGGNMLYLAIFGNDVENRLGGPFYLMFYILGGLAAGGLQVAIDPSSAIPSLGASGAIAAVLGAYVVLFPGAGVWTIVIPLFPTVRIPAPPTHSAGRVGRRIPVLADVVASAARTREQARPRGRRCAEMRNADA